MDLVKAIRDAAGPIIDQHDAYLIDCIVRGERGGRIVEIYIDSDRGITTELCAGVSRDLGSKIDAADLIPGRYRLEVSSPGLDRPLKLPRQYPKNIGRTLKVQYSENGETKTISGLLTTVREASIVVENEKGTPVEIPMNAIGQATVEPSFR